MGPHGPLRVFPLGDSPAGVGLSFFTHILHFQSEFTRFSKIRRYSPPPSRPILASRFHASVRGITPSTSEVNFLRHKGPPLSPNFVQNRFHSVLASGSGLKGSHNMDPLA